MIFYRRPHGTQLECCSAASRRRCPLALSPRWKSAATRLVGPLPGNWTRRSLPDRFPRGHIPFPVEATARGRRSFVAHYENRNALSRLTDEQKRYLEGFATGLQISKVGRGFGSAGGGKANIEPT